MIILITLLSSLFAISSSIPSGLSLANNQSFRFLIPSQSIFQLNIRPSQFTHLLVQLDSCRLGFIKVTNISTSENVPPASLYQFSYVYNITNHSLKLAVDYTTTTLSSYMIVYGFNDFSKLPSNVRTISTLWTDEQLKISFEPVSIYNTVIECNYTIQFYTSRSDYNCRFNDTQHVVGEITIPSHISNNLTNINVDIPLNSQYHNNKSVNYTFNNLFLIQQLLNSGQVFEVQIYAQITKPVLFDTHYIRTKIEPQTTLEALRNGFIIIIVGILVYGLITCVYLFCKRKYKNPNYFHQETEAPPHHDEIHHTPKTGNAGTADQLNDQH